MGRASKWIRNLLLGKKDNRKRSDITFSLEYKSANMESLTGTPKIKRKWSFRKSAGKDGRHKFSKSLDSIEPAKLSGKAPPEPVLVRQNPVKALVMIRGHVENLAATKIQAVYRAYLAKKALHALRGLVKLQALVRGHIVRKQTASMMKQIHALMSIQVRARFQRIQMAEQTQLVARSQSSMDKSFMHNHRKPVNIRSPNETRLLSKSNSDHLDHSQIKRINPHIYSDNLSISKQQQYEEFPFGAEENSPRSYSAASKANSTTASLAHQLHNYRDSLPYGYPLLPNYMINTESSRAKTRSQSEPKQRPNSNTRQKNKQKEIKDDAMFVSLDDPVIKRSSSQCKLNGCDNPEPCFFKISKPSAFSGNGVSDYVSNFRSHSTYYKYLTDSEACNHVIDL